MKDYRFPPGLARKLRDTYPHLSEGQAEMVLRELRNFFHVARAARGQMVSMPSQAVDVAWHEFILFTRGYRQFCRRALGRFLDQIAWGRTERDRGMPTAPVISGAAGAIAVAEVATPTVVVAMDVVVAVAEIDGGPSSSPHS